MKKTALLFFVLALGGCAAKESRPMPGDSVSEDGGITLSPPRLSTPNSDPSTQGPIESRLYPPELAMEHQTELGITDDQRSQLIAETEKGNSEVLHRQWELEAEKEKLVKLLEPDHIDEAKANEAAARVMDRETKVKAAYLTMLIRVKNILTTEQKEKLRALRSAPRSPTKSATDLGAPPTSSFDASAPRAPSAPKSVGGPTRPSPPPTAPVPVKKPVDPFSPVRE